MSSSATSAKEPRKKRSWPMIAAVLVAGALVTAGILALLVNIMERKEEAKSPYFHVKNLDEKTFDPAVWGENFPLQYEGYKKTSEMPKDEQATPPAGDPRKFMAKSKLKEDPRLVTMWQGYAFSVEYNEPRGHEYMLQDQQLVKRVTQFKQPGACLNCHASIPQVLDSIGGDKAAAWATMNKTPYKEAVKHANGPIACIDCHDPKTMKLRVTRPAFIEGIKEYKAGQGIKEYDVNKQATAQEMRTFVCAQCHVEYYFKGEEKTLTFPWDKGLTVDDALAYYDEVGWKDFEHKLTGAPAVKAQHPDFETWSNGVHASAGVGCADCHMSYTREGATKVSNHQVASPMRSDATINSSCLTCHHSTEAEMKQRVNTIHDRYEHAKDASFDALDALIKDIEKARKSGVAADKITEAQKQQRKAQFFMDYVVSENSRGFHAPAYTISILNDVTDASRKGQLALRGDIGAGAAAASTASPSSSPSATASPTSATH
ncbi:MAG: ammonia-forming cytochrome c nitrite reductase subunit c552 [Micrococcales bacterium]|nr:ammonia-forming cytochrome c nitrite reductase subunit c552 [Micrococcales bacterium]